MNHKLRAERELHGFSQIRLGVLVNKQEAFTDHAMPTDETLSDMSLGVQILETTGRIPSGGYQLPVSVKKSALSIFHCVVS
jgi:hypothetical protein